MPDEREVPGEMEETAGGIDELPDALMLAIVEQVSPEALDTIAMKYMGIRHDEILTISAAEREQITMKKFRVLELWRNRNSHLDVKQELYEILRMAQRDGLIDVSVYSCLASSTNILMTEKSKGMTINDLGGRPEKIERKKLKALLQEKKYQRPSSRKKFSKALPQEKEL